MDYYWGVSSMDSTIDNCLKQLVWPSLNLFCKKKEKEDTDVFEDPRKSLTASVQFFFIGP